MPLCCTACTVLVPTDSGVHNVNQPLPNTEQQLHPGKMCCCAQRADIHTGRNFKEVVFEGLVHGVELTKGWRKCVSNMKFTERVFSPVVSLPPQRASPSPRQTPAGWEPGGWATSSPGSSPCWPPSLSGSYRVPCPWRGRGGPTGALQSRPASSKTLLPTSTSILPKIRSPSWRWPKVRRSPSFNKE